jgi:hypothetical protein
VLAAPVYQYRGAAGPAGREVTSMRERSATPPTPGRRPQARHRTGAFNPAHRIKLWLRPISLPWTLVATAPTRVEAIKLAAGIIAARRFSGLYCIGEELPKYLNQVFIGVCASGRIIQEVR